MGQKEFREILARKIQIVQEMEQADKEKQKKVKQKDLSEIMPAIGGVKKNIENFKNSTKEAANEER